MKKAEIIIYGLFLVGIILKLLRLPFHTVFLLSTILSLLVYYFYCLIAKKKEHYSTLTGLVTALWLFYLLSILKFFSFQNIVGIVTVCVSVAIVYVLIKNKKAQTSNAKLFIVVICATLFFKMLPSHYTYYLVGIKYNYRLTTDYFALDKYSWFLYNADKHSEAIEINKQAQIAVEKSLKNPQGDEAEYSVLIKKHESEILNKNWKTYP